MYVTAGNGALTAVIADEVDQLVRTWGHGDVLTDWTTQVKLSAGVPGIGKVEVTGGKQTAPQATRAFRELVAHTARPARQDADHKGVVLLIDELQSADEESLRTIAYAWQELQASNPPVPAALLSAGLSHTPDVITAAVTHAERFSPDSGDWLTTEHLDAAQQYVDVDLTELYRTRWAKASPRERQILAAMASSEERLVARRDIAAQLGVDTTALSMARQSLLDKGIVDSPVHGMLAFTVPGFGAYVRSVTES